MALPVQVTGTMFEGLFVRALQPTGAFAEALLAAGFDLQRVERLYPIETFWRCVDLAHRWVLPHRRPEEADRELGRRFAEGFMTTLPGSTIAGGLPIMGAARLVDRIPHLSELVRSDLDFQMEVVSERERLLHVVDHFPRPYFFAGCIEVALARAKSDGDVTYVASTPTGYALRIRW